MKMVYTCIINITGYWEISLTLLYPVTLKPLSVICRRKYIGYSISYQGQSNSFYYKGSWSKFVHFDCALKILQGCFEVLFIILLRK